MNDGLCFSLGLRLAGRKWADRLAVKCGDGEGTEAHSAALKKIAPRSDEATVSEGMMSTHSSIDIEKFVAQKQRLCKLSQGCKAGTREIIFSI